MSKLFTILIALYPLTLMAQEAPVVPEYGKLILIEERSLKPHFELGLDGGVALDNTSEDVYSINLLGNYVHSPIFSFGLEATYNKTENKAFLERLKKSNNVKVMNFTPDWFTQATLRISAIKGHLNALNKWHSPFELALVLGGGMGYNDEQSKTSSLISWGGEFLIPFKANYKAALGIRHYKSYPFQEDELSFTSMLLGVRRSF